MKRVHRFTAVAVAAFSVWSSIIFAAPPTSSSARADGRQTPSVVLPMINVSARSERCEAAIQRAVKFLLPRQNSDGGWQDADVNDTQGGQTALVTLALLSAGVSHQADPILKAMEFLHKARPTQTYSVALRACVYAQLPNATKSPELRADVAWLQKAMISRSGDDGMFTYGASARESVGDYSNSQYGVLGVWYAAEAGIDISANFWKRAENAWIRGQQADGGWGYIQSAGETSYASMTAAAAATLFITNDFLHTTDTLDLKAHNQSLPLERAMQWLANYFAPDHNPGRDAPLNQDSADPLSAFSGMRQREAMNVPYTLFGYERVGEASGFSHFGAHRWFDEGADFLCRTQRADDSWTTVGTLSNSPEVETAYALLFLTRGRSPVAMQKLRFGPRWNNRPRDVADFINYLRYNTETHLNWQLIDLDSAASELREAPILYASSDRAITLGNAEKANLRDYILRGGVLFAVNEGDTKLFSRSIEALGADIFPGRSFHPVQPNDNLYTGNFRTSGAVSSLRALDNGIRNFIVLVPADDLSWKWEVANGALTTHLNPYTAAANLWSETIGGEDPLTKGQSTWFDRNITRPIGPISLHVTRLKFDTDPSTCDCDPEPAGWERFSNLLHNSGDAELHLEKRTIAQLKVSDSPAHLTAFGNIILTSAERAALKQFIDAGGLLIFDAAGGSAEASDSFQAILSSLYPTATNEPIPIDHPIYAGHFPGGRPIEDATYRLFGDLRQTRLPRLRALTLNHHILAILSPEDISAGLVGYPRANFSGYSPQSAATLMRAILLWDACGRK